MRKLVCKKSCGLLLTKGEVYDVIDGNVHKHYHKGVIYSHQLYYIRDASGDVFGYHKDNFYTIEEHRELKLNELGI
jgi:hypothetical protein